MTNRNTLNDKNNSLFETYQFSVISTWTWQTVTVHTCSIKLICIFRLQHKNRRLCSPDKIESFEADFDKTMNMTIEIFSCSHFLLRELYHWGNIVNDPFAGEGEQVAPAACWSGVNLHLSHIQVNPPLPYIPPLYSFSTDSVMASKIFRLPHQQSVGGQRWGSTKFQNPCEIHS